LGVDDNARKFMKERNPPAIYEALVTTSEPGWLEPRKGECVVAQFVRDPSYKQRTRMRQWIARDANLRVNGELVSYKKFSVVINEMTGMFSIAVYT
jgi:hypothetical protein